MERSEGGRFRVRPAVAADAPVLPAVERAAGEVFRALPDLSWIADDAVQSEQCHRELIASGGAWVAEDAGGRLIGFLNGAALDTAFHIHELSVVPERQGEGIGRALLAAARGWATGRGFTALTLTTFRDVPWNGPFYARLGFAALKDDALSPALMRILDREAAAGLPRGRRCAMMLPLP